MSHTGDTLDTLIGIENGITENLKEVTRLLKEAKCRVLDLERERGTISAVLAVTSSAKNALEELLEEEAAEEEAPEVPSNVTQIRTEDDDLNELARSKAKPPTERDKLKAIHVSGVLGFNGAEKPDFL